MAWGGRRESMDPSWGTVGRIVLVLLLVGTVSAACVLLPIDRILKDFILWVQRDVGPWGPIVYALAYVPCTVFAIPASILTLGGGYLYGLPIGFVTDSVGSTAGAVAAFIVGRTIGRSYVTSKLKEYPQFQNVAVAIERSGFKIVVLLRMVPLLPYNMLNYLLAVTPISCYTYTLASWIGMMPLTLVFVYAGTTIKDIADFTRNGGHFTPARWIILSAGLFTSVVVVIVVTRIARDALQRAVQEEEAKMEEIVVASGAVEGSDPMSQLQQPLVKHLFNGYSKFPAKFELGASKGSNWKVSSGTVGLHCA